MNPKSIAAFLLFSSFIFTSNICAQFFELNFPPTVQEKKILELQDSRSANYDELFAYLNSNTYSPDRGLLALLNIADTNLFEKVKEIYLESPPGKKVKLALLFSSLNITGCEKFLLVQLQTVIPYNLRLALHYSLSRIGGEESLRYMAGLPADDLIAQGDFMQALPWFSIRRIGNEDAFKKAAENLKTFSISDDFKSAFAYSINRLGNKDIIAKFVPELVSLTESDRYTTRMWSFAALGKLLDTSNIELMLTALEKESDWRVRVNIANALGNKLSDLNSPLTEWLTSGLLKHAVQDSSAHVSIAAWQALGKLFAAADTRNPLARKIQQEIGFVLSGREIPWQIKAEAIRTYAKIFKDEIKDELLLMFSTSQDYDLKAAIVGSFAFMDYGLVYKELRDSISADVQRYNALHPNKDGSMIGSPDLAKIYKAFVESLAELDNKLDDENRNIIRLIFSEFSASKNPAITDVCLTNLQDSMYLKYRPETCQVMMFDYAGFNYPKDKDVMLMFIQAWSDMKYEGAKDLLEKNLKHSDYDIAKSSADALKNITGTDYEKKITATKYKTDFDWKFIDDLDSKKYATIKTTQGNIKIELFPDIAPFTVQSFVKLGEKGFYDNTIFHRVVPNFVIQGGDPTGTGYGGPGYSIRSEFSPYPYREYTVGMASSGKDTEGSQFFITHSPQPHLDTRYTVFGKVTEGFNVVDKIQIGDKIQSIIFSSE
jgi:peptidylprolyl isomerase